MIVAYYFLDRCLSLNPILEKLLDKDVLHRPQHIGQLDNALGADNQPLPSFKFSKPRGCVIIITMFAAFVLLSCFLGVFFTVHKEYGYSMGDSFTLAGYVITVGTFVSAAVVAYHYPHCRCWTQPDTGEGLGFELLPIMLDSQRSPVD